MNIQTLTITTILTLSLLPLTSHAQSALSVDLLWEAQTYTPSSYQGHSLPSSESTVRAIAIPYLADSLVPTEGLFFTWSKDGVQDLPRSGQGKNVYSFTSAKKYGKTNISVSVSSGGRSTRVEKSMSIPVVEPRVVLYPYDTARGLRGELAYGTQTSVEGGTVSMKAEPYYFSRGKGGDVLFRWTSGGNTLTPTDPDKSIMTFGVLEGVKGNVDIRVTASHINNLLQEASKILRITFDQEPLRF